MNTHLNLTSLPEPATSRGSGRLAPEDVAAALPAPAGRTAGSTSGCRTPSRQSSRPSGATAGTSRPAAPSAGMTPEIALDQLRVDDQIVIQTAHSTYIFLVIDPAKRLGLVVGGVFGDYAEKAYLEVFPVASDCCLGAGARVRFYTNAVAGGKHVTTSAIIGLIHRKAEAER